MTESPLLSYLVLSYNYEPYIRQTLESIFTQSVQDFEIVVVDDASADRSVELVTSIGDPRIRLLPNERNIGGAASYNRAVEAARGEWLVNLDADDWIAPDKAELQLAAVRRNPDLDVVGTYVSVRDEEGEPHPSTIVQSAAQSAFNESRNLNLTDSWVGINRLCRSSTMVRATSHARIGLDDPDMVRAPDYELWTRALQAGLHMDVVPDELTFMRVHARQVTHVDPLGTFLEMSFAALRNLLPRCERLALYTSYAGIVAWAAHNPGLSGLLPVQAFRLLGMLLEVTPVTSFGEFRQLVENEDERPYLAELGRRGLTLVTHGASPFHEVNKLQKDILQFVEARDYWHAKSDMWEERYQQELARNELWKRRHSQAVALAVRLRAIKRRVSGSVPRRNGDEEES
jgi:GT2 family glycosyltransferase